MVENLDKSGHQHRGTVLLEFATAQWVNMLSEPFSCSQELVILYRNVACMALLYTVCITVLLIFFYVIKCVG